MSQPEPNIYLAPFQGITTFTYRDVYSRHFPHIDKLFTPFYTNVQTTKGVALKAKELELTAQNNIQVVPQILSKEAGELLRFAQFCSQKGHTEVNWNMGCPFPRVAKKQRGSGLLPHPETVASILCKIQNDLPLNLSIKCRLGYEEPDEINQLIPIFNQYNISEVTLHARLGKQLYKGRVDWSAIGSITNQLQVPFVYNGDIFSATDYQLFNQQFPHITTVMIGRGLLTDPLLPAKIKGIALPPLEEQKLLIKHFMEDLYLSYRKYHNDRLSLIGQLKELWSNLAFGFENPGKVFGLIKKNQSFEAYETATANVFKNYSWVGSEAQLLKPFAYK